MMTTLGKAVDRKLCDFIGELMGRYTIDNERDMIPIINEEFTAKQLPDKCINALDKWVDSYVKEENK